MVTPSFSPDPKCGSIKAAYILLNLPFDTFIMCFIYTVVITGRPLVYFGKFLVFLKP